MHARRQLMLPRKKSVNESMRDKSNYEMPLIRERSLEKSSLLFAFNEARSFSFNKCTPE